MNKNKVLFLFFLGNIFSGSKQKGEATFCCFKSKKTGNRIYPSNESYKIRERSISNIGGNKTTYGKFIDFIKSGNNKKIDPRELNGNLTEALRKASIVTDSTASSSRKVSDDKKENKDSIEDQKLKREENDFTFCTPQNIASFLDDKKDDGQKNNLPPEKKKERNQKENPVVTEFKVDNNVESKISFRISSAKKILKNDETIEIKRIFYNSSIKQDIINLEKIDKNDETIEIKRIFYDSSIKQDIINLEKIDKKVFIQERDKFIENFFNKIVNEKINYKYDKLTNIMRHFIANDYDKTFLEEEFTDWEFNKIFYNKKKDPKKFIDNLIKLAQIIIEKNKSLGIDLD